MLGDFGGRARGQFFPLKTRGKPDLGDLTRKGHIPVTKRMRLGHKKTDRERSGFLSENK